MTRTEHLHALCDKEHPGSFPADASLIAKLEAVAVTWFIAGLRASYDGDTGMVRDALVEFYEHGSIAD